MPTNKDRRASGVTVNAHEGLTPTRRQQERQELIRQTITLVNAMVGEYMRAHSKDNLWATPVRAYYECLVHGKRMPGGVHLDGALRPLVRFWVEQAAQQTGYTIPPRPSPKRKKR